MSGQTPERRPRQRQREEEQGSPPPDQGAQPQLPNAPGRRRGQATRSRDDADAARRRRRRQQQFDNDIDEAAREDARTRGGNSDPTVEPLMNIPELKL